MAHLNDSDLPFSLLQFYATSPYPCSYLPGRMARSQVATPTHLINASVYSQLVRVGFRRSGVFTYRPQCDRCNACVPVRLPVARLQLDRSQRRSLKKHGNLAARELPLAFFEPHYELYARYQATRHAGGGMDEDSHEQYAHFLLQSHVDTRLIEFSEGDELRMVSLIDFLEDGLSSVYTFFDPEIPGVSFGTYNILWQAQQCAALGLPYLYLGYWIRNSRKMAYKTRFRPIEGLIDGEWQEIVDIDALGY
ncbi:MAG: putative arginyl-tRNA:protein arginylyltransferase [Rhodocyclaceae bacterium]|nr:putative arginyl-tRNA:protein arginylyltransferase [Rhodocyclaceae bacterium]